MKDEELKVGNYVHYKGEWCYRDIWNKQFQWEDRDWYAVGECTMDLNDIYPIPLTEEWLEKFGFIFDKFEDTCLSCGGGFFYDAKDKSYRFKIDKSNNFKIIKWEEKRFRLSFLSIKYVHQLQNLYYSLTGEELNESL